MYTQQEIFTDRDTELGLKYIPLNTDTQTLMYNTIQILKLFVYDSNSIVIMFGTRVIGSPHIASMFL